MMSKGDVLAQIAGTNPQALKKLVPSDEAIKAHGAKILKGLPDEAAQADAMSDSQRAAVEAARSKGSVHPTAALDGVDEDADKIEGVGVDPEEAEGEERLELGERYDAIMPDGERTTVSKEEARRLVKDGAASVMTERRYKASVATDSVEQDALAPPALEPSSLNEYHANIKAGSIAAQVRRLNESFAELNVMDPSLKFVGQFGQLPDNGPFMLRIRAVREVFGTDDIAP